MAYAGARLRVAPPTVSSAHATDVPLQRRIRLCLVKHVRRSRLEHCGLRLPISDMCVLRDRTNGSTKMEKPCTPACVGFRRSHHDSCLIARTAEPLPEGRRHAHGFLVFTQQFQAARRRMLSARVIDFRGETRGQAASGLSLSSFMKQPLVGHCERDRTRACAGWIRVRA